MLPSRCLSEACKKPILPHGELKKNGPFVKWGHVNTLLWMTSASRLSAPVWSGRTHAHMKTCMAARVRVRIPDYVMALECHRMTKGEQAALNEFLSRVSS